MPALTRIQAQTKAAMDKQQFTAEVAQEFHRHMAHIIEAVQAGIWQAGVHDLVGYATDYAFGMDRGLQTLVLRTGRRSTYVRLQWNTIIGQGPADLQLVDDAIKRSIRELT